MRHTNRIHFEYCSCCCDAALSTLHHISQLPAAWRVPSRETLLSLIRASMTTTSDAANEISRSSHKQRILLVARYDSCTFDRFSLSRSDSNERNQNKMCHRKLHGQAQPFQFVFGPVSVSQSVWTWTNDLNRISILFDSLRMQFGSQQWLATTSIWIFKPRNSKSDAWSSIVDGECVDSLRQLSTGPPPYVWLKNCIQITSP